MSCLVCKTGRRHESSDFSNLIGKRCCGGWRSPVALVEILKGLLMMVWEEEEEEQELSRFGKKYFLSSDLTRSPFTDLQSLLKD